MSNKGPSYGLSLECKIKIDKKFDIDRARDVLVWIEAVLDQQLHPDAKALASEHELANILKDGAALCGLMNTINPGSIKGFKKATGAFKQMENIELFTKACVDYGVKPLDVFQVADLYERKAMFSVLNCLHAVGSLAQAKGFTGPRYGVKIADKNERNFTEEQFLEAKKIIPMQAGSNRHPSQSGMTPYGSSRQIIHAADISVSEHKGDSVISLQYGTNKLASQSGMTPYGLNRQILASSTSSHGDIDITNNGSIQSENETESMRSSSEISPNATVSSNGKPADLICDEVFGELNA